MGKALSGYSLLACFVNEAERYESDDEHEEEEEEEEQDDDDEAISRKVEV